MGIVGILALLCLLAAVLFAALATTGVPANPKWAWLPAAFLFWLIYVLLTTVIGGVVPHG